MTYELTAGSLANLKLIDRPLPPPAPGEVSAAVRFIGINFTCVLALRKLYGIKPER